MAMRKYLIGLILLAYFGTLSASQDSDFIAARQAFQTGDAKLLDEYARRLQRHALWPYIDYFQLRMVLRTTDITVIRNFISRYEGNLVADRLRGDWLRILGKNQQWQLFESEYPLLVNKDTELNCYSYQQRLYKQDKDVLTDARSLWFTPTSMPDSCTPVFQALIYSGQISLEDIWTRIRLALEEGQTSVATHINRYIPSNEALNNTDLNNAAKIRCVTWIRRKAESRRAATVRLSCLRCCICCATTRIRLMCSG